MTGCFCVLILLLQLYSVSEALKVISTNMKDLLPDMTGQVVVLNSSLAGLDQWTVCLRVKTFHSSFHHQGDPYQTLIGRQMFLGSSNVRAVFANFTKNVRTLKCCDTNYFYILPFSQWWPVAGVELHSSPSWQVQQTETGHQVHKYFHDISSKRF